MNTVFSKLLTSIYYYYILFYIVICIHCIEKYVNHTSNDVIIMSWQNPSISIASLWHYPWWWPMISIYHYHESYTIMAIISHDDIFMISSWWHHYGVIDCMGYSVWYVEYPLVWFFDYSIVFLIFINSTLIITQWNSYEYALWFGWIFIVNCYLCIPSGNST